MDAVSCRICARGNRQVKRRFRPFLLKFKLFKMLWVYSIELLLDVSSIPVHSTIFYAHNQFPCAGLTQDEMQANAILFLLAGYDTVATALSFTLFCLAANHNCLKRVQEELDEKLGQVRSSLSECGLQYM